jgi:uncharacterized protein YggE
VHHASVELTATFTDVLASPTGSTDRRDGRLQVGVVDWQLARDPRPRRTGGRHDAVAAAVERATAYASAIGRRSRRCRSPISGCSAARPKLPRRGMFARAAMAMDAAPPAAVGPTRRRRREARFSAA